MNRKTKLTAIIGVALVLGIAAGWYFIYSGKNPADMGSEAKTERKVLYWTDPMVPGYRSDKPGPSPFMDMDLVPVYADEAGAGDGAPVVTIRPEFIQNFGVRTHQVTRGGAASPTGGVGCGGCAADAPGCGAGCCALAVTRTSASRPMAAPRAAEVGRMTGMTAL